MFVPYHNENTDSQFGLKRVSSRAMSLLIRVPYIFANANWGPPGRFFFQNLIFIMMVQNTKQHFNFSDFIKKNTFPFKFIPKYNDIMAVM